MFLDWYPTEKGRFTMTMIRRARMRWLIVTMVSRKGLNGILQSFICRDHSRWLWSYQTIFSDAHLTRFSLVFITGGSCAPRNKLFSFQRSKRHTDLAYLHPIPLLLLKRCCLVAVLPFEAFLLSTLYRRRNNTVIMAFNAKQLDRESARSACVDAHVPGRMDRHRELKGLAPLELDGSNRDKN